MAEHPITSPSCPRTRGARRAVAVVAAALLTLVAVGALGAAPSSGATLPYTYAIHFHSTAATFPVTDLTGRVWVHTSVNSIAGLNADNTVWLEAAAGRGGPASVAPDGTLWFADINGHIESFSPSMVAAASYAPVMSSPSSVAVAPDGTIWYASFVHTELGHIHPDGSPVAGTPTVPLGVLGMTRGPDGNIWYSNTQTGHIGWFDPVTGAPLGDVALPAGADPKGITNGPDGNLWFVEATANRIGRITPAGVATEFSVGLTGGAGLFAITAGSDGNLWFTEAAANQVGRITPTGVVTEFALPADLTGPGHLAVAANGTVYFSVVNPPNTTDAALGVLSFTVPPPPTTTTTTTTAPPAAPCGTAGAAPCPPAPVGVTPRFTG